ncbi:MAG TPA: ABC transporter permease [Bryobacteraceae bacterium]
MRWRRFRQRRQRDEDLAREVDSYLAHEIDDNVARGMRLDAARDAALRKFGNATYIRETIYEMNTLRPLEAVWQDFRYGLRQLRSKPGFALAAILSLALGIGANTAVFTLVDQILLRLLPVHNPRELVQLEVAGGRFGSNNGDVVHTFSYPTYLALRDQNTVLSGLTGQRMEQASLVGPDRSEMIGVGMVAGNYFGVLGVPAQLGRLLTPEDNQKRNGHPVAVLQYDFWQNRFAGSPDIVGNTIRLNGTPFTVIGVSAQGFEGTDAGLPAQVWIPVMMKSTITPSRDDLDDERSSWLYLFGRLKPGVTLERAQAAMHVLYRQRQQQEVKGAFFDKFPQLRKPFLRQNLALIPAARGQSSLRFQFERPLIVLQWLVGVVLLIACANVANLLLARAAARQREVAIRGALGAKRGQIVRQFFIESLILALAGGIAGLILSSWLAHVLIRLLPFAPANLSLSAAPDNRVLLFTAGLTILTAFLFGIIPALHGSRIAPGAALKEEAGSVGGGHGRVGLRKAFVTLQVALSCLLLITAGLFARTLDNLRHVDLGFKTENVATFVVRPATSYEDGRKLRVYQTLIESLATVPGVKAVGANRTPLLSGGEWDSWITIPGVEPKSGDPHVWSYFNAITPGYFEALGIPIKAGRDLSWQDWGASRRVCLVNEALVQEYLGGTNPIGRMMAQGEKAEPNMEIIGVFGNAKYEDVRGSIPRQTFVSLDSKIHAVQSINVYARIQGDPRPILSQLRAQARRVDPNLVVSDMRTLDDQLNMRLSNERILSFLSMAFALLATLLAVIGLGGVLAFVVAQRTREIGIRVALGAGQASVIGLVLREMLLAIGIGLGAGVTASLIGGRYIESQLFEIKADDPLVLLMSVGAVVIASLAAAFVPVRRAAGIDPAGALRYD